MDLVKQQINALQDTHGTESTSLTFSGGNLQAVRPEELSDVVSRKLLGCTEVALAPTKSLIELMVTHLAVPEPLCTSTVQWQSCDWEEVSSGSLCATGGHGSVVLCLQQSWVYGFVPTARGKTRGTTVHNQLSRFRLHLQQLADSV